MKRHRNFGLKAWTYNDIYLFSRSSIYKYNEELVNTSDLEYKELVLEDIKEKNEYKMMRLK